jgi:large subunit ribosomal protein L13
MAKKEEIRRNWYLVDAKGKTLGRLATKIAKILEGKHKPIYTPGVDTGDFVVAINARYISVTGKKRKEKVYRFYSGYPGGLKERSLETMLKERPAEVLRLAVKRMLPKGPLGRAMFKKFKVYPGAEYPHKAQRPQILEV